MSSKSVDIRVIELKDKGRTAVAQRVFQPGEIVLMEHPALVIPYSDIGEFAEVGRAISRNQKIMPNFFDCIFAADRLPTAEIRKIVGDLYSPFSLPAPIKGEITAADVEKVKKFRSGKWSIGRLLHFPEKEMRAAEDFFTTNNVRRFLSERNREFWEEFSGSRHAYDTPKYSYQREVGLLRVVAFSHAVRLNLHTDDSTGKGCVFAIASKFAHECAPNTLWRFQKCEEKDCRSCGKFGVEQQSMAVHIATRQIDVGDPLTFSYLGTGMNMYSHTLERRRFLSVLNFSCSCNRCLTFDRGHETCRMLKCRVCHAAAERVGDTKSIDGTVHLQDGQWACNSCEKDLSYVEVCWSLRLEAIYNDAIMRFFFGGNSEKTLSSLEMKLISTHSNGLLRRWHLVILVRGSLGPRHYLTAVAESSLMRSFIVAKNSTDSSKGSSELGEFVDLCKDGMLLPSDIAECHAPSGEWYAMTFHFILELVDWLAHNMPNSPQHLRAVATISEVISSVIVPTMSESTDPAEQRHVQALNHFRSKRLLPLLVPFRHVQEFAPMDRASPIDVVFD